MIPLRDDQPRFSAPYLNNFLIGLNLLIYLFESALAPDSLKALIFQFGVIPSHVTSLLAGTGRYHASAVLVPFFTSMFLHGSWPHVIGNMWFLWIFGDNIEDHLGHLSYLLFYLVSGVVAAMTQVALEPGLRVPTVGASGAIAGVLGAYFVLYPKAHVLTWFPPIFFFHLPAWVMLGYWFGLQFLSGAVSSVTYSSQTSGGIAFWAHVGGFVAGVVLIKVLPERPRRYRYAAW